MVGHLTLDQAVGVRVPAPQPRRGNAFEGGQQAALDAFMVMLVCRQVRNHAEMNRVPPELSWPSHTSTTEKG